MVKWIKLALDDNMHEELWRRKERIRRIKKLRTLTWEKFIINAIFKKWY